MSCNRLAEIKARADAATDGPWSPLVDLCGCADPCDCGGEFIVGISQPVEEPLAGANRLQGQITELSEASEEDLQFLIHSRADVDWLVSEVDLLRRQVDVMAKALQLDADDLKRALAAEASGGAA